MSVASPRPGQALLGLVLAGGSSTRMAADKPSLVIGRRTMLDHVTAAVTDAGVDRVAVSGRRMDGFDPLDDPPGISGPAAGLLAAFRRWPDHDVVLVAADQPMVIPETLRRLATLAGDAVVPVDVVRQTTCAVYRTACHPALERLASVETDPSLQRLLDEVAVTEVDEPTWRSWGEDGRSWHSIDTPEDLAAARAAWPDPPAPVSGPRA